MFDFRFKNNEDEYINLPINNERPTFFVGGNGSGKSSLITKFFVENRKDDSIYVQAHRKNTFDQEVVDFSNSEYRSASSRIAGTYRKESVRYNSTFDSDRISLPIVNLRNQTMALAVKNMEFLKNGGSLDVVNFSTKMDKLNDIFFDSGMDIEFFIDSDSNIMARNNSYSPPVIYSLARLSDGEKSALIIASDILCAEEGALIVLDEPERHLHKRIVSPLLASLIDLRKDCIFVISTHELTLPSFIKSSQIVNVKGCTYFNSLPIKWDVSVIDDFNESLDGIDEQVKYDVLGSRSNILFVEGVNSSLDIQIYSELFENTTIIPKEKCDLVEQAVKGLRNNEFSHMVNAFGIIDNDNKPQKLIDNLKSDFVYCLNVHSIESVYYHPVIIRYLLEFAKEANAISSVDSTMQNITEITHRAIKDKRTHLCSRAVEKKIRSEVLSSIPNHRDIGLGGVYSKVINFNQYLQEEYNFFDEKISSHDYGALVSRYPIRESNLLKNIATECGFADCRRYQLNVIRLLKQNVEARNFVYSLLGGAEDIIPRRNTN